MSDVLQMYPRATPDRPPSREVFAVGRKEPGEETETVELRRHCAWCEPLTDEQRRYRGVHWTSVMCSECAEKLRAGTWTPDGGSAA